MNIDDGVMKDEEGQDKPITGHRSSMYSKGHDETITALTIITTHGTAFNPSTRFTEQDRFAKNN